MADVTIQYTQGPSGPGEITLTVDGSPTTVTASGRLDAVGNRVVSPGIAVLGENAVVECVRTSSDTMRVVLVFNPRSGYDTGSDGERVIDNVPLDFS